MICRLHLSSLCVVSICQGEEEEGGGPDLSLKSNNPTLKGGEKHILKKYENVDLHPTQLAGRAAAAGQLGGVQVHMFICVSHLLYFLGKGSIYYLSVAW